MNKALPSFVTVEEAVARMVNMDYIPAGFSLLDMTGAFLEEAEVYYENARIDRLPEDQITPLRIRMEACMARHALACHLLESLQHEINNPESSMINLTDNSSGQHLLSLNSVSFWAADKYGIGIPELTHEPTSDNENTGRACWEDVTIKIWKGYKLGFSFKKGEYKRSNFRKVGLMGEAKYMPNQVGLILIGLSKGKIFPVGQYSKPGEKTAISKLRNALRKLTGLSDDPFQPYNQAEGWKPRFTLIDDVNNAEERAKKKAKHVNFDETKHFDD